MRLTFLAGSIAAAALSGGCTNSSAVPLAADTVQITTSAAPVCGAAGAQSVALRRAAIETINRGYDKFIVVGGGYQNNVGVIGHTPVVAQTAGAATAYGGPGYATAYGNSTTTYSGGQPIIAGSHDQGLVIKLFKNGDPAGANAVSARGTLGPDWKQATTEGTRGTC
jgi:hypothetical protein